MPADSGDTAAAGAEHWVDPHAQEDAVLWSETALYLLALPEAPSDACGLLPDSTRGLMLQLAPAPLERLCWMANGHGYRGQGRQHPPIDMLPEVAMCDARLLQEVVLPPQR